LLTYSGPGGTPMCHALRAALALTLDWARRHPRGQRPVILHLTDGEATDGDPEFEAIGTSLPGDDPTLPVVVHALFLARRHPVAFPASEEELVDGLARKFFRLSGPFLPELRSISAALGVRPRRGARALLVDADVAARCAKPGGAEGGPS
jgi:hypothetical protein